jgi:hypothetical protein
VKIWEAKEGEEEKKPSQEPLGISLGFHDSLEEAIDSLHIHIP